MRRLFKRACALIPALALVLSLTACGGGVSAFDATKQDDKTYSVKVTVEPIDIFHLVADALNGGAADDFNAQYDDVDVASMSDDEYDAFYAAYDAAWAQLMIDLTREKLPELGYLDSSSLLVQVAEDEDGLWGIPQSDFDNLDWLIIDYNF